MISQGEVYYATIDGGGRRPVIVVSEEPFNRGRYVSVVPCTSKKLSQRKSLPNCVPFAAGQFGLPQDCVVQCELMAVIQTDSLETDPGPLGTLDDANLRSIIKAIGHVIDSDCEPN